jgi:hypothetical protein
MTWVYVWLAMNVASIVLEVWRRTVVEPNDTPFSLRTEWQQFKREW